jgi:hypothetical protein
MMGSMRWIQHNDDETPSRCYVKIHEPEDFLFAIFEFPGFHIQEDIVLDPL